MSTITKQLVRFHIHVLVAKTDEVPEPLIFMFQLSCSFYVAFKEFTPLYLHSPTIVLN